MHLLHLINAEVKLCNFARYCRVHMKLICPQVELRLSVKTSIHSLLEVHHSREADSAILPSSQFRLITSLSHYTHMYSYLL